MKFEIINTKKSAQLYVWALFFIAIFPLKKADAQKIPLDKLCILTQKAPFDQIQFMSTLNKWQLGSSSASESGNNEWSTSEYFNNQNFYQYLETKFDVRLEFSNPYVDKKEYCLIKWKTNSDFIFKNYLKKCSDLDKDKYPYIEHLVKANFRSYDVNLEMSKIMQYNNCILIFYQDDGYKGFVIIPNVYISWVKPIVERKIFNKAGADTSKLISFIRKYPKSQFSDSASKKIKSIEYKSFKKRIKSFQWTRTNSNEVILAELQQLEDYIKINAKSPWIKQFSDLLLESYFSLSMKSNKEFISRILKTIEFQKFQKVTLSKRIDTLDYLQVSKTITQFLAQTTARNRPVYDGLMEVKAQISQLNNSFKLKCEQRINSILFESMRLYINENLDCNEADIFSKNVPYYKNVEVNKLKMTCVSLQNNRGTRDSILNILDTLSLPYTLNKSNYADVLIKKINNLDRRVLNEKTNTVAEKWRGIGVFHEKNINNQFKLSEDFSSTFKELNSYFVEQLLKEENQYINKNLKLNFTISTTQDVAWLLKFEKQKGDNRFLNGTLKAYKKSLLNKDPLLVYGNMVNASDNFSFRISNQSKQYHADFNKKQNSFDKKNRFFNKLNNPQDNWEPGHYIFEKRNTSINNQSMNTWRVIDYQHFAGPTAIFSSLLVPGNGTNKVNGNRRGDWVTATVYTLLGVAALYYSEAQTSYENYSNSTIQSNMNGYYDDYVSQMNTAKYLTYTGGAVYGINLLYVFSKGLANLTKSVHYTNKYRPLTFPQ